MMSSQRGYSEARARHQHNFHSGLNTKKNTNRHAQSNSSNQEQYTANKAEHESTAATQKVHRLPTSQNREYDKVRHTQCAKRTKPTRMQDGATPLLHTSQTTRIAKACSHLGIVRSHNKF